MDRLVVTKELAARAILFGACSVPKIGTSAKDIDVGDLIWAEKIFSAKELKAFKFPLWTLSGSGSGDGYGYGSGDGSGNVFGSGNGDWDGSGYGSGTGSGFG